MGTPYCTPQDVVDACVWPQFEQLSDSAQTRLIATASEKIDELCRRPYGFAEKVVIEWFDGRGQAALWLSHRPVREIMSVAIDGDALDNTDGYAWTLNHGTGKLVRGNGYHDSRFGARWLTGERNIVVQYWGGFPVFPDRLVTGTAFMVRYLWEQGKRSGLYQGETIGDYSYTLKEQPMAGTVPVHVFDLLAGLIQDDAFA